MKTAHWIRLFAFAILLGITAHFLYAASIVRTFARADERRPVDAILVMGAAQYNGKPSPVLRARLDHAAKLYKEGYAPVIVVTGGKVPGDTTTEAGASATYLHSLGIPDSAVLREVEGRTSWQSLRVSAAFLKERGMHSVLLVSDTFHDARIRAMARELGMEAYVSPTTTSPIRSAATRQTYLVKETIAVGLGNVFGYRLVGWMEDVLR